MVKLKVNSWQIINLIRWVEKNEKNDKLLDSF